ncbi:hypothetical protein ACJIZ3_017258 [Penstemon smallii]|uniref:non-specific serine/threonine protein kinase n=1 Tax=Penstemon smallii TaxID=265156 RepID=A0ABD3SV08_9LAMI
MAKFMKILTFLIFFFITCFLITPSTSSSNETDVLALLNFKAGIELDPLGALNSWNQTSHFCNWNGIQCGSIPPSIGNLTSLTHLYLGSSSLNGEIPESLAQLQSLVYLNIGENNLTGRIPHGLFNISTIITFAVHANKLQGEIPFNIGLKLPNLEGLYLGGNQLTGLIPASLSNASSLEHIVLLMNSFTGPMPNIGGLSHLQTFTIALNQIQDDISFITSLTNCTNLQLLEIGDNLLTGSLPNSIVNMSTYLSSMAISNTQIHGKIPFGIGNLVGLTRLSFQGNYLDGSVPPSIGELYNVREMDLGGNRFTNQIPSSFNNLTWLILLSLSRNNFSGSIQSLSNCTNLLDLDLSYNNFNGPIPPEIMSLSSISISLNLSYNSFVGSIPFEVGFLSSLTKLDLSNNRLSGFIPRSLSSCLSLQTLYLEANSLEGEIPGGLSALTGLQDLDLSRNNFFGPIPRFLSELRLEKLNLSHNRLQGEVPIMGIFRNRTLFSLDGNEELFSVFLIIFLYKQIMARKKSPTMPSLNGNQFLRLSYADLLKATDGFNETNLVGSGRYGSVYKGILDDETTLIAVKVLNLSIRGASKSFLAECNALRGIRHRNLLKILSVCESIDFRGNDFKALVYEFKENGSLDRWLYQKINLQLMTLACLHESLSHINVTPKYSTSYMVSIQGDVYSYGILLLEMFTKKRPTDEAFSDHINLHNYVSNALPDRVMEIVDPFIQTEHGMNSNKIKDCLASVLSIAVACSRTVPRNRISMKDVVIELHKIRDVLYR